jgi:hypothetical protein
MFNDSDALDTEYHQTAPDSRFHAGIGYLHEKLRMHSCACIEKKNKSIGANCRGLCYNSHRFYTHLDLYRTKNQTQRQAHEIRPVVPIKKREDIQNQNHFKSATMFITFNREHVESERGKESE